MATSNASIHLTTKGKADADQVVMAYRYGGIPAAVETARRLMPSLAKLSEEAATTTTCVMLALAGVRTSGQPPKQEES